MNNINKIHDICGIKTRWGIVDQASYNFLYPTNFLWCGEREVDLGDMIPEIECNLNFIKDSSTRIVTYVCKKYNAKFSLKAFLKAMRKPTSDTFEDFPKCVIINECKFRICSINYGKDN